MENLKAVVLCGGLGSRLRPFTYTVPKPLLPIGERPIIELTLRWLRTQGLTEVGIALGWRGDIIRAYLGDGSQYGLKLHYVQETKALGTAGPLSQLRDWIGTNDTFVMNGDILTQLDLSAFVKCHRANNSNMTIATRYNVQKSPFGVLTLDKHTNVITAITEKPEHKELISTGMYVLSPTALQLIPTGRQFDMPDLLYSFLVQSDRFDHVRAYVFDEPWIAIEQQEQFNKLEQSWLNWANSLEHQNLQMTGKQF